MLVPANVDNYEIWEKLNFFERSLYLYLAIKYIEGSNGVLLSVKDIMKRFGMSKRTITSAISNLAEIELIKREHTYRDNRYKVFPCWLKLEDKSYGENKYFIDEFRKRKEGQQ